MHKQITNCDLLIIGGGIAGSTLARAMSCAGYRVIVVEKELAFRDRIRGEVLLPWGSLEAQELGIYDVLLQSCARELPHEIFFYEAKASDRRDFRATTPNNTVTLTFFHPEMQESLLEHAKASGAEVWRGAGLTSLRPGSRPEADIVFEGSTTTIRPRLIVGADGRESQVAALLELERETDETELYTGGLQFSGELEIEPALYFFLHAITGRASIVTPNRPGNFRIYLMHHKDALPRRLSGARDYDAAVAQFHEIGLPREWLEQISPYGTFATFDGAHRWIRHPEREGCVLVGDAAATSDPVWGNGLSRTLRDVRLLRDRLLEDPDWTTAASAYAADHDNSFFRLRRAERLNAKLHFAMGEEAEQRRQRAYKLMGDDVDLYPDIPGLGPEARCSDEVIGKLLGHEHVGLI